MLPEIFTHAQVPVPNDRPVHNASSLNGQLHRAWTVGSLEMQTGLRKERAQRPKAAIESREAFGVRAACCRSRPPLDLRKIRSPSTAQEHSTAAASCAHSKRFAPRNELRRSCRLGKSSRLETISKDTDRLKICATTEAPRQLVTCNLQPATFAPATVS